MAFDQKEAEQLLADCGRCCICGTLHRVQVHHIKPRNKGGTDDIKNGISLCPNCHDEVHTEYSPGRITRIYTPHELKLHKKRTIDQVEREGKWKPGTNQWRKDKKLIEFFAQCLDRPAFRTYFHQELSFVAFDKAMEATLIALNTGYWRTRDGTLIQRPKGKAYVVNPKWREKIEKITEIIEDVRRRFHEAFGLDEMLYRLSEPHRFRERRMDAFMKGFRHDRQLGDWMDKKRQKAIEIMNSLLEEVGLQELRGLREH